MIIDFNSFLHPRIFHVPRNSCVTQRRLTWDQLWYLTSSEIVDSLAASEHGPRCCTFWHWNICKRKKTQFSTTILIEKPSTVIYGPRFLLTLWTFLLCPLISLPLHECPVCQPYAVLPEGVIHNPGDGHPPVDLH
jgi:hypothetical protein